MVLLSSLALKASGYLIIFVLASQLCCALLKYSLYNYAYGYSKMKIFDLALIICKAQCAVWTSPERWLVNYEVVIEDSLTMWLGGGLAKYSAIWLFVYLIALTVPDPHAGKKKTVKRD